MVCRKDNTYFVLPGQSLRYALGGLVHFGNLNSHVLSERIRLLWGSEKEQHKVDFHFLLVSYLFMWGFLFFSVFQFFSYRQVSGIWFSTAPVTVAIQALPTHVSPAGDVGMRHHHGSLATTRWPDPEGTDFGVPLSSTQWDGCCWSCTSGAAPG